MKRIALLMLLLVGGSAFAADNAVTVTPGSGVTMKSKDVGAGVQAMQPVLSDTSGNALATPTAGADGVSNSTEGLATHGFPQVYNGSTWDRWRGDATNGAFVQIKTVGGTAVVADPCQSTAKTYTPVSITTATTTKIITGASAKKTYICHLLLTSAAADNVGIVEGTTGGTCGSGTAGLIGGTTAANGPNFAANGGLSIGNGGYAVAATATNQNDICLITSAATPLAGVVSWVQQ